MPRSRSTQACVLLASVLVPLALVNCGTSVDQQVDQQGDPPDSFTEREQLQSCGVVDLDQGEVVPDSAWACLDDAHEKGAELVVTTPTAEGAPITMYYRVGPDIDGLELFVDNSADSFAAPEDRGWLHQVCSGTDTAREPLACRDADQ